MTRIWRMILLHSTVLRLQRTKTTSTVLLEPALLLLLLVLDPLTVWIRRIICNSYEKYSSCLLVVILLSLVARNKTVLADTSSISSNTTYYNKQVSRLAFVRSSFVAVAVLLLRWRRRLLIEWYRLYSPLVLVEAALLRSTSNRMMESNASTILHFLFLRRGRIESPRPALSSNRRGPRMQTALTHKQQAKQAKKSNTRRHY